MIGSRLGSYEILEEIGRGGMGCVYKARQPSLDRIVAVKVLLPQLAADHVFVERFLREARSIATLEHPGIVTVYDVGESEGTYYFAMQLLDGRPLDEILAEGKALPVETAVEITRQVAGALHFAHKAGILHRDVKPGNIIVTGSSRAILTDFGIAKALADTRLTKTGTSIGSPEYMAPEQIEGKTLDARADLYSLGVVLFQMLIGEVPYKGESAVSIVYQHVKAPVPSPREIDPKVPELIDRVVVTLLAKFPDERFASAEALLTGLDGEDFETGLDAAAKKPPLALPKWAWGAAAGVVALIVVLILAFGGGASDEAQDASADLAAVAAGAPGEDVEVSPEGSEAATEVATAVAAAPVARQLRVTTAPDGATVVLDGKTLGATPTSVELFPETRYDLQLRLDGHDTVRWTFGLADLSETQDSSGTLHFPLKSSVPPGILSISASYPVEVQVSGRSYSGKRIEVPPGEHTVRIHAPGVFFSQTRRVRVTSGATEAIALPIAVPIKLSANPSRCRVKIDGMDAGYVPAEVQVTVGQHDFEFSWESLGKSLVLTNKITTRSDRVFATAPR